MVIFFLRSSAGVSHESDITIERSFMSSFPALSPQQSIVLTNRSSAFKSSHLFFSMWTARRKVVPHSALLNRFSYFQAPSHRSQEPSTNTHQFGCILQKFQIRLNVPTVPFFKPSFQRLMLKSKTASSFQVPTHTIKHHCNAWRKIEFYWTLLKQYL